jgi:hypothetical protein
MKGHPKYYILATVFISLFILSIILFISGMFADIFLVERAGYEWLKRSVSVSFFTMIFTGIGTFSTLILGWRNERRTNIETDLKLEKLALEVAELKSKDKEKEPKIILK